MEWTEEALSALQALCGCFRRFHSDEAAWEARAEVLRRRFGEQATAGECERQAKSRGWAR